MTKVVPVIPQNRNEIGHSILNNAFNEMVDICGYLPIRVGNRSQINHTPGRNSEPTRRDVTCDLVSTGISMKSNKPGSGIGVI